VEEMKASPTAQALFLSPHLCQEALPFPWQAAQLAASSCSAKGPENSLSKLFPGWRRK